MQRLLRYSQGLESAGLRYARKALEDVGEESGGTGGESGEVPLEVTPGTLEEEHIKRAWAQWNWSIPRSAA